jgi:hypothetical protein
MAQGRKGARENHLKFNFLKHLTSIMLLRRCAIVPLCRCAYYSFPQN